MNKRVILFVLGLFFLFLFYLFSVQVKKERFKKINFDTTIRLQDKAPKKLDEFWEDAGFFVSPTISVAWAVIITLVGLVDIKKKKIQLGVLLIPICFGLMVMTEVYGKDRVESPAPPFFMIKNPTTILPRYYVQEAYSYPSGHAARSLFLSVITVFIVSRYMSRRYIAVLFVGALIFTMVVSMGKVILGQHWLSDILGGWIVAGAFLMFSLCGLDMGSLFSSKLHVRFRNPVVIEGKQ